MANSYTNLPPKDKDQLDKLLNPNNMIKPTD